MTLRAGLLMTAALAAAGLVGISTVYWNGLRAGAAKERPRTAAAEVAAVNAGAQAKAALDAAEIADRSAGRAQIILKLEGEHRAEILKAPGADNHLDPRLLAAARRSLCQYQAYADDPECAVFPVDPAKLPQSGGGDALAGR